MKVGIMQPYFLPYIGYWQLMNAVDMYVVYDDVNYITGGWINRNRILVNGQPKYITIPIVDASQNRLINETKIDINSKLLGKNLKMIELAYKKAPFFNDVYPLIEEILNCKKEDIVSFIMNSFKIICGYLDIRTELMLSSSIQKDRSLCGQDKILAICEQLGASQYYNAIGGQALYSYSNFNKKNMELNFVRTKDIYYRQFKNEFQGSLSIIDVLMFNSREDVKRMLLCYDLIKQ